MRIVILDDDSLAIEDCTKVLQAYAARKKLDLTVDAFTTEQELLAQGKENAPAIAFLDIRMGDKVRDGIQIGSILNEKWPDCRLVYFTDYITYASDVYRTRHTYFVLKDELEKRIDELFTITLKDREEDAKLAFTSGWQKVVLKAADILYFERNLRTTQVITVDTEYTLNDKLSELLDMLPERLFCRCHTSYLVNLDAVKEMKGAELLLKNGSKIPISRKYKQQTREKFMAWMTGL